MDGDTQTGAHPQAGLKETIFRLSALRLSLNAEERVDVNDVAACEFKKKTKKTRRSSIPAPFTLARRPGAIITKALDYILLIVASSDPNLS